MSHAILIFSLQTDRKTETMKALVFHGPNHIAVENVPRPGPGYGEAVIRVTLTTICGTDVHIVKGEYPECSSCLNGNWSQCGGTPMGGWRFGNTINGAQAEYLLVPYAQANMARIPTDLSDEQVILLADIASTGFSASESAGVELVTVWR